MIILFIILWLLCGIISVIRSYYGLIKRWYILFNEDIRKDETYASTLKILLFFSPIFIMGGLVSLFSSEYNNINNTWYFKIPK